MLIKITILVTASFLTSPSGWLKPALAMRALALAAPRVARYCNDAAKVKLF